MTDEQSVQINLSSPLDINSQDMLVQVNQPKFTYNRQKYQGSLLQTSVRYEADGWFAGWWGHNFDLVVDANDTITPTLGDPKQLSIIRRVDENNNKVYNIKHKDLGLKYTYNPTLWEHWLSGAGNIARVNDNTVSITAGVTNLGNHFTASIDPYTGVLTAFSDVYNVGLKATAYKEGENLRLEVIRDVATSLSDYLDLRVNNIPVITNIPLSAYTYDNVSRLSTWNNLFALKVQSATTFSLDAIDTSFEVQGTPVLSGFNTQNEEVTATIKDVTVDHLIYSFQYKAYWVQDLFATAAAQTTSMSQQITVLENDIFADFLYQRYTELRYDNACVYRLGLPIWLQHRLEFDYSIVFDPVGKPAHLNDFNWTINIRGEAESEEEEPPLIDIPGFVDLLNTPGAVSLVSYILPRTDPDKPEPSPFDRATRAAVGIYRIIQPDNPRYSIMDIDVSNLLAHTNLLVPVTFQPYKLDTNNAYDPRPVVWNEAGADADIQIFGLKVNTDPTAAKVMTKNLAKYGMARVAQTKAEIDTIPDGIKIEPFQPEYLLDSGIPGVDVIENEYHQPDPTAPNYDPREYVHGIIDSNPLSPTYGQFIRDPDVKPWVAGGAAKTNNNRNNNWGITVTPNYDRYWLQSTQIWQADWNTEDDIGKFWPLYWPELPAPEFPIPLPNRANPYLEYSISGVKLADISIITIPDTQLTEYQPMSASGTILPPHNLPDTAVLTLGNFVKKSILHSIKDISDVTNWSWAFKLVRTLVTTTAYRRSKTEWGSSVPPFGLPGFQTVYYYTYKSTSKTEYYDSNGVSVANSAPLVWKPITASLPPMRIYDMVPSDEKNTTSSRIAINDQWYLYLKCKNGYIQFPIPTKDFNNDDQDESNYFQINLWSNGNFRDDQVLMNLFTKWSINIPSYTDDLYKDNYRVLNRINLTRGTSAIAALWNSSLFQLFTFPAKDPGVFSGTNTKAVINVPLCVPGYAVSQVNTPRILNTDLTAFEVVNGVVSFPGATYMWHIDDRGAGYPYDLNLVKGEPTSVQPSSNLLYVTYNTTGVGPFYQLLKPPYTTDSSTGEITGYQDYSYPDWILRNLTPAGGATAGSYNENDYTKIFMPGSQGATVVANITVLLRELDFIDSVVTEAKYTTTPYNNSLFESIAQYYTVSKPTIHVQGTVETHNQTLLLSPDTPAGDTFETVYNPDTAELVGQPIVNFTHWLYKGYTVAGDTKKPVTSITIDIESPVVYDLVFRRTLIVRKVGQLLAPVQGILKQEDNIVTLNPDTYGLIDLTANKLYDSDLVTFVQSDVTDDVVRIYVAIKNSALVYFKPDGLISRSTGNITYSTASTVTTLVFEYQSVEYTLRFDMRPNLKQYLSYKCTDIRTGEMTEVYQRDLNDIMLFVKQFWSNTVDVENYWWIDADHVLELAKHTITLYKKVGIVSGKQSVHDWNGDNWEVENERKRSAVISTDDLYYSVTSAYNTSSMLFKLRHVGNKIQLLYIDPLATYDWDDPRQWSTLNIAVEKVPLASGSAAKALPHDSIGSYAPLNIDSLITTTKISSTTVGLQNGTRKLLIGIKQNNGLGQWCLIVNIADASLSVVVGYGCVGPKGELTGGQIPIEYCNASGFTGVVQDFKALPETLPALESLPKMIVGTASQQWFIQQIMTGIVSHMTFDIGSGTHTPVPLYLNNNVSVLKHYATYRGSRLQDVVPQSLNIATLFGSSNPAINILVGIVSPSFFYLNIFYAVFVGIATAMGTYSYTWHNSNEIKVKGTENLTDQDMSFGKYEFNKALAINNKSMHSWAQIIVHMVGALPETVAQVVVNKSQGQSATDDSAGRKFSQLFEDSVSSTLSTAIDSSGFNVRAQSIIKHQYSLTSFYSINDKIECHAGPGFVNHNLKAQCTAQSMQDIQLDGKQLGFFSVLTALTKLTLNAQITVLEAAYEVLERSHDNTAQQSTQINPGASINWGYLAALGISATMAITAALLKTNQMILANLDGIIEAFGGKTEAFMNNWDSAHTPTQEGLHTYGNKSMSFFWPAFGIDEPNTYTNEGVTAKLEPVDISISMTGSLNVFIATIDEPDSDSSDLYIYPFEAGLLGSKHKPESARIPIIKCLGTTVKQDSADLTTAPENMTVIEGTTAFLNKTAFKNEQIGVGPPAFGPPMIHDFMIDKEWALGYTAGAGAIISVSCDDTKLIDGPPSNVVITDDFCGVASSYIALEIKKTFDEAYLRPTMVTANAIGLNINRINCVHDAKAYHAFDGQVNRIVSWTGGQGMDKELLYQQYLFQMNDHFKRSNIFPPAQFFGSFQGPPVVAIRSYETVSNTIVEQTTGLGFGTNTPGENRNLQRFSTCVFSELLSSLPTMIRTLAPYKLRVNDGVTCLVTELRNTNTRYKAPTSIDFNIGTRMYRKTEEYIVEITEQSGVVMTETRTPSAGLELVGPTMTAAYFYSPATKLYYEYAGGTELVKKDILNRFKNVREGRWDFINQEIIFNVQLGRDSEEMILRLDQDVHGEVWPPNKTIYNDRSGFKIYSCAGGLVYQGPKRFIVSRFVTLEHMIPDIKKNKRKWKHLDREQFVYERDYGWAYEDWYTETPLTAVSGWTHNPFLLVTSMLGTAEDIDNKFEWSLTFAWSDILEQILEDNEYVTVNVMAETVTQGGVVRQRPTHIYLSKEVFTRSDNAGYYTIKFQSNSGIGNRERLFIWSDGIVAQEDLKVACKQMTSSRTQPLITQVDLERLVEL